MQSEIAEAKTTQSKKKKKRKERKETVFLFFFFIFSQGEKRSSPKTPRFGRKEEGGGKKLSKGEKHPIVEVPHENSHRPYISMQREGGGDREMKPFFV